MSLSLSPSRIALAIGRVGSFAGSGGVEPYTYSVLAGGVGGSVDGDGFYTAPTQIGIDTVQVKDSNGVRANAQVLVGNPTQLVCEIIQREMDLADGRVYLWDQKINSPTDEELFIAVSVLSCRAFANTRKYDPVLGDIQSVNMTATLSIDAISRGTSARDRKEEILMALNSSYAETQQSLNSFRIFPISDQFTNLSEIDGSAIPYRFNISAKMQYFVTKTKTVPFFDDFADPTVTTEP